MSTKEQTRTAQEALTTLMHQNIGRNEYNGKPILYFITRSVAKSGMSRVFSVYALVDGELAGLDHRIATACGYTETAEGFRVGGCGMDMRFAVSDYVARLTGFGDGNNIDYRSL